MSDGKDDPVGYRRPPKASRFKPGQSGNLKGRPKGSKNFSTAIQAELDSCIVATENGKRRKITKRDALSKQIVNRAVSGELKAISMLLNEMRQIENQSAARSAEGVFDRPEDHSVMENIKRRILAAAHERQEPTEAVAVPEGPISKPEVAE
jgi:hypothetical protein